MSALPEPAPRLFPALSPALLALAAALLLAPAQTWLLLGGNFLEYLDHESPPGQVAYVLSKLVALYAVELLWLQALLGLLRPRWVASGRFSALQSPTSWRRLHRGLGVAALLAMGLHVLLFTWATTLRNRELAWDLLLPWGHGVYRTWVAFGAVAWWLVLLAVLPQWVRAWRARPRARLWVHRLALLAAALVAVHSLNIGSESRSGWMSVAYAGMAVTLLLALADRYVGGGARRAAPAGPGGATNSVV